MRLKMLFHTKGKILLILWKDKSQFMMVVMKIVLLSAVDYLGGLYVDEIKK